MSRRIDIELTSATDDGFTWRVAGAKQPKGTVNATVLPADASVGDELKVEVDLAIDGIEILSVVQARQRVESSETIELLPTEREFKPVVETRAKGGRKGGRDGDRSGGAGRRERGRSRDDKRDDNRGGRGKRQAGGRGENRGGRRFNPPPEVPQRPKPKRLRPGKQHRNELLARIPEEQRQIAELALQGMKAVRQRVRQENAKLAKAGKPEMPEATILKMAEDQLPKLRVAEWLDRATAAIAQIDNLDLRDLRSVVAAAADPVVVRDESTRQLATELQKALVTKQEEELALWFSDVDASLAVGRVVRALRLSAKPPKAGVPFPVDIAERLVNSANASLAPTDPADRWIVMLEAAAFSPVHADIKATRKPDQVTDELLATVKRLAPALPQIAALFEVEVDPKAPMPKPLRPDYGKKRRENKRTDQPTSAKSDKSGDDKAAKSNKTDKSAKTDEPAKTAESAKTEQAAANSASQPGDDTESQPAAPQPPVTAEPTTEATEASDADRVN